MMKTPIFFLLLGLAGAPLYAKEFTNAQKELLEKSHFTDAQLEAFGYSRKGDQNIMGMTVNATGGIPGRVAGALQLLKQKSYYDYQYVLKYIKRIENGDQSVVSANSETPTAYLKESTLERESPAELAAALVHEACHVEISQTEGKKTSFPAYEDQQKEEQRCIDKEKMVIRKLGATVRDVSYLARQDGAHFDANKDGKYDEKDRTAQTW